MPCPRRNPGSRLRYGSDTTGPGAVSTASATSNSASGHRHRHPQNPRRNPARPASAFPAPGQTYWHGCSWPLILGNTAAVLSPEEFFSLPKMQRPCPHVIGLVGAWARKLVVEDIGR